MHKAEACSHCHSSYQELTTSELCVVILEKISAVALAVFSAYVDLELFLPFFTAGIALGIYGYLQEDQCKPIHPVSSCSHGFLEQITGVKLPTVISLGANVAITICHIDHHAAVFIPIVGLSIGAWVGQLTASTLSHFKFVLC